MPVVLFCPWEGITRVAISRRALEQRLADVETPIYDETITIAFRDGYITPARLDRLDVAALVDLLAHSLIAWDVIDDDGQPLVPEPPVLSDSSQSDAQDAVVADRVAQWRHILSDIPLSALWQVYDGMMAALQMRPQQHQRAARLSLAA